MSKNWTAKTISSAAISRAAKMKGKTGKTGKQGRLATLAKLRNRRSG